MNDTQLLLLAAKTLISYPEDWERIEEACDVNGRPVSCHDNRAVRWCPLGSLLATSPRDAKLFDAALVALELTATRLGGVCVMTLSLHSPHEGVMAMFDHAIELAEGVE